MGLPAGASLALFIGSSHSFSRMSFMLVSWIQESANLSSRWRFCSARIFWASVRSTFGPALTGVSCESTAPKTGSTVSFVWQHGHVTCRFSLFCFAIAIFYAFHRTEVSQEEDKCGAEAERKAVSTRWTTASDTVQSF